MPRVAKKKIQVSKHVKKFLMYYFDEPYVYSNSDFISPLIAGVLKKGYRVRVMKKGESTFEVHLKCDDAVRLGKIIEWEDCLKFNKAVDNIFRTQLFTHMDMNRKLDKEMAKPAMVQMLTEMNITEDDIDYETLYRDYKRKKVYPKTIHESIAGHITKNIMGNMSLENGQIV